MDSTTRYAECAACNCSPGFCAARERESQAVTNAAIRNVLDGVGGYTVPPGEPSRPILVLTKNRAQRRREQRLTRRGPPGKKRK